MVITGVDPILEMGKWLKEHDGNWEDTHKYAVHRLWEDDALREKYIKSIVSEYAWYSIRHQTGLVRLNLSRTAARELTRKTRGRASTLLDWPLQGGFKLGEARSKDLDVEIEGYETNARSNAIRALWLRRVQDRLPNPQTKVKSVLTAEEVDDLYKSAEGDYDG